MTLIMASRPASAQTITGQIVDAPSRTPLWHVPVMVLDVHDRVVAAGRSDSIGAFYLDVPAPGRYRVVLLPVPDEFLVASEISVAAADEMEHHYLVPSARVDTTIALPGEAADSAQWVNVRRVFPHYPPEFRSETPFAGDVTLLFVVSAEGRVEPRSVQRLRATDPAFAREVEAVLPRWRFTPARRAGRPVRQYRVLTVDFGPAGRPLQAELGIRGSMEP
jgi:TonB family protein